MLDMKQAIWPGMPDHAQEGIHARHLFELFIDEPVERADADLIVLLSGQLDKGADIARDLLLPVEREADRFFGRCERLLGSGNCG